MIELKQGMTFRTKDVVLDDFDKRYAIITILEVYVEDECERIGTMRVVVHEQTNRISGSARLVFGDPELVYMHRPYFEKIERIP